MLKDITFGQYYKANSVVHRLDPRTKISLLIFIIVMLFLAKNAISLTFAALFVIGCIIITKVPIRLYLKNIKTILPTIIFTAVINIFYGTGGTELFKIWLFSINTGGIFRAVYMASRIILLITVSSTLTYTTTPNDLTDGIEKLLSPLRVFGLKSTVHTLSMMMTIALRFIPTLVEETEKIMNAQKARGADLENGKLLERIKALIPILIPLLISAVKRAYELAEAMECRCYNGGEGRVRMKQLKATYLDFSALLFCLMFGAAIILINILI